MKMQRVLHCMTRRRVVRDTDLRDLAGTGDERVNLPSVPCSVEALLRALEQRHGALGGRLQSVRVAVDEEFAELSRELVGGEVVALIPPVSGG